MLLEIDLGEHRRRIAAGPARRSNSPLRLRISAWARALPFHGEQNIVGVAGEQRRIGVADHRRRVEKDQIVALAQVPQQAREIVAAERIGKIDGAAAEEHVVEPEIIGAFDRIDRGLVLRRPGLRADSSSLRWMRPARGTEVDDQHAFPQHAGRRRRDWRRAWSAFARHAGG